MRILVTGPLNPVGQAVVAWLAGEGHQVRAFGTDPAEADPFAGQANVESYPGWAEVGGSLEPDMSECQALIHCASLDAPAEDQQAHAVHIERGTLYARYAAERELVGAFVVVLPPAPGRVWGKVVSAARDHAKGTRNVPTVLVESEDPDTVIEAVKGALAKAPPKIPI